MGGECQSLVASWLICTDVDNELLHRAIQSCLTQTVDNFEIIVVSNGASGSLIKSALQDRYGHDRRFRFESTEIRLLNFSLSLGIHIAGARYIARMDSDDVADPTRLELQLAYMEQHPDVAVLGSAYDLIDDAGRIHGSVSVLETDKEIRENLYYSNPICHPSAMLRKEAIQSIGGYLGGRNAEDYDLWLRLAVNSTWKFANLSDRLICYNVSPDGAARRSLTAYANVAAAQLRNFVVSKNPRWLLGAALSVVKAIWRSNRM